MTNEEQTKQMKRSVGLEAACMVKNRDVVGLGTGSTAVYMIEELGRRVREEGLDITGIPTSFDSAVLARKHGVPVQTLDDVDHIDIAIDGADEVDLQNQLIKGRGAAHLREKIIDGMAVQFVVVVDESKLVDRLGTKCAVPLEVLPLAVNPVLARLEDMDGAPTLRMGVSKDGPVITDQGNMVIDVRFDGIDDPRKLESTLNNIPGILENGLFIDLATTIFIGRITAHGEVVVERRG
jgi:ribose 5-phosphate isomerase A